jgi:Protein of unknown function (DUF1592)/Protein of unknown function (DUF1588)/Protein of unknown function (DUF1595)/Protein of unknown function (DUF1585)
MTRTTIPHAHTRPRLQIARQTLTLCSVLLAGTALSACTSGAADSQSAAPGGGASPGANAGAGSTLPGSSGSAGMVSTDPGTDLSKAPAGDPAAAGLMPLRYMTSREYLNTVSDLLTDTSLTDTDMPTEVTDPNGAYFPFRVPGTVGNAEAEALQYSAETIAANVQAKLSTLLPCAPANAGAEASCATQFITTFGAKAYRRPLDAGETTHLNNLYQTARSTLSLDFKGAIGVLIEAILQSPAFYYHWQLPAAPATLDQGMIRLDPYTLANRLSYFIWGSMPDPALFDAAAQNKLASDADVEAQVRRMLAAPQARNMASDFVADLLDMDLLDDRPKDPTAYSMYDALQAPMLTEVQNFGSSVLIDGTGTLNQLFSSTATTLNQPLAALYGVSGITGMNFQSATLPSAQRGGLLTLAGFMANMGSEVSSQPPRRGKFVITRLMCVGLPPPPPNVPKEAPPTLNVTTRQRFEQHSMNPCATGCHTQIDPMGFPFEHYDGIGAYRDTDSNQPVNSQTTFTLEGATVTVANAMELEATLAKSSTVHSCLTKQWLRYAFRRLETDEDTASLQAAAAQFKATDNLRDVIVSLAKSRTFRFRKPAPGEVL